MRALSRLVFSCLSSLPLLACNALVGVEDVERPSGSPAAGGSQGGAGAGGAGQGGASSGAAGQGGAVSGASGDGGASSGQGGAGMSGASGQGGAGESGAGGDAGTAGAGGDSGAGGDAGAGGSDAGAGGDSGAGGTGGSGGDSGSGGTAAGAGGSDAGAGGSDAGAGGSDAGAGGSDAGAAGQGGSSGSSGQGGAAGQGGSSGSSGQGGAGQAGCGPATGSAWAEGKPIEQLTLTLVQDLKVGDIKKDESGTLSGPYQSRTPLNFSWRGDTALRATWGGRLLRYTRNPTDGTLSLVPNPPVDPATMENAASMLLPAHQEQLIIGGNFASTAGHVQLYQLNSILFQLDSFSTLDDSKKNPAINPVGFTDVRALAEHPSHRWFYALYSQNPSTKQSALAVMPLYNAQGERASQLSLSQPAITYPIEFMQAMMPSPDGKALYATGVNRIYRHAVNPSTGTVSAPQEIPLPANVENRPVQVLQGVACQIGDKHHVYAPLTTNDITAGNPSKVGLWHLVHTSAGALESSNFYGHKDSPALDKVRHITASKDCSRLFVAGSEFTGDSSYQGGFQPSIEVYTIHPQTGALTRETGVKAGTPSGFKNIVREPFVTLSPDERHLYVHAEWQEDVSVFRLDRTPAGDGSESLTLRHGPPSYLPGLYPHNPGVTTAFDACPPGQILRGFSGFIDSNPAAFYKRRLAEMRTVCERVEVQPGAPPTLKFSSGLISTMRGDWGGASEPWSNLCPDGHAVVGHRPRFAPGGGMIDIQLSCAPVSVPCELPYRLELGAPITQTTTSPLPADTTSLPEHPTRSCPPGSIATGVHYQAGEIVENVLVFCGQPWLAVSPQECAANSDCPTPGADCEYAICVQGKCEAEHSVIFTPSRNTPDCRQVCGLLHGPTLTLDIAPLGDNGENVSQLGCVNCSGGQLTTHNVGVEPCGLGQGNYCGPGGMCLQAY